MTNNDAFTAFAFVIESNPRYIELIEKQEDGIITAEEKDELMNIIDDTYFNPFMYNNIMAIDEEEDEEEEARLRAKVQDLINRGVFG